MSSSLGGTAGRIRNVGKALSPTWRRILGVLVLTALAGVLRFSGLGIQSVWYDEATSASIASGSLWDIVTGQARDNGNPPLFVIALFCWTHLFGTGDSAIRSLSALVGTLSVPVLYKIGVGLLDRRRAFVAALLLALSPFHLYYSQEARAYALVTLLVILSNLSLMRLIDRPRSVGAWLGYVATAFGGLYTYYFFGFCILGQTILVCWEFRRDRRVLLSWFFALALIGLLYLVWIPVLLAQLATVGNLSRAATSWRYQFLAVPLAYSVGRTLVWQGYHPLPNVLCAASGLAAVGLMFLIGAAALLRQAGRREKLLALWFLMPLLCPLILSVGVAPMFYVHYSIMALPAWCLIVASGSHRLFNYSKKICTGAIVLFCVGTAGALVNHYSHIFKDDWRDAVRRVEQGISEREILLFDADFNELSYARYAKLPNARYRLLCVDSDPAMTIKAVPSGSKVVRNITRVVQAQDSFWLILAHGELGSRAYYQQYFGTKWIPAEEFDVPGIHATRYMAARGRDLPR